MKPTRPEIALRRLLDSLEAELLGTSDDEMRAVVRETGMSASSLLSDLGDAFGIRSIIGDLRKAAEANPDDDAEEAPSSLPTTPPAKGRGF